MKQVDFARYVRAGEAYRHLAVPDRQPVIVRVDGRAFTHLTNERFTKPFDLTFAEAMVTVATELLDEFGGVFAYVQSDEVSVLLREDSSLFGRRVEKIASVAAGIASAAFTLTTGAAGHFDARVWRGENDDHHVWASRSASVIDYFSWRQSDAERNALNSTAYWTLVHAGHTPQRADEILRGVDTAEKVALLADNRVDVEALPLWQSRGMGLWKETVVATGINPHTGEATCGSRDMLRIAWDLPRGEEFRAMLSGEVSGWKIPTA